MAQSDQVVQNATFPTVRADINDNLAALYSQSSGNSAPTVTVAFQPWVDTSVNPPIKKVRNGSNTAWITEGVLDPAGFKVGGITPIANGGTGTTTAALALAALLPSQSGNAGKALVTSGSAASWGTVASGASVQVFTANGTYTPTAGKTTFLVFATGGGGGGGRSNNTLYAGTPGGGGGTAFYLYNTTQMGASASITVGAGGTGAVTFVAGSSGGNSSIDPAGTGVTISGLGGAGGLATNAAGGGAGGGATNSLINIKGSDGFLPASTAVGVGVVGLSFFAAGQGAGGLGGNNTNAGSNGVNGIVLILEW
jgi:hypothetical protein